MSILRQALVASLSVELSALPSSQGRVSRRAWVVLVAARRAEDRHDGSPMYLSRCLYLNTRCVIGQVGVEQADQSLGRQALADVVTREMSLNSTGRSALAAAGAARVFQHLATTLLVIELERLADLALLAAPRSGSVDADAEKVPDCSVADGS